MKIFVILIILYYSFLVVIFICAYIQSIIGYTLVNGKLEVPRSSRCWFVGILYQEKEKVLCGCYDWRICAHTTGQIFVIFYIKYTMMREFQCKQLRIKECIVFRSECSLIFWFTILCVISSFTTYQ